MTGARTAAINLSRPCDKTDDIALRDWDDLLNAVKERLRLTVGKSLATTTEPLVNGTAAWVQSSVLECVTALDQLHMTLTHELGRRQHLERGVFDAKTALASVNGQEL